MKLAHFICCLLILTICLNVMVNANFVHRDRSARDRRRAGRASIQHEQRVSRRRIGGVDSNDSNGAHTGNRSDEVARSRGERPQAVRDYGRVGDDRLHCFDEHSDPLRLFEDEACHLAWLYALQNGNVSQLMRTEHVGGLSGAFLVQFRGTGARAHLKTCQSLNETLASELLAYTIDRLLGINRVPPVVMRKIDYDEVEHIEVSKTDGSAAQLRRLWRTCNAASNFTGVLIGAVPSGTDALPTLLESVEKAHFRVRAPFPHWQLEFVRMAMSLFVTHAPLRAHHQLRRLSVPKDGDERRKSTEAPLRLVSMDNDDARWTHFNVSSPPAAVCNRHATDDDFQCVFTDFPARETRQSGGALGDVDDGRNRSAVARAPVGGGAHARAMGLLLSFLCTACTFPSALATRLLHFDRNHPVSASVRDALRAADYEVYARDNPLLYRAAIVDETVSALRACVEQCERRYDRSSVFIEESATDTVHDGALLASTNALEEHVDPRGHRYRRRSSDGVWIRID